MRFYCLGDEETVRGFRLAGVDGRVVAAAAEAERAVAALLAQGGCGVLILTERVSQAIPETVRRLRGAPGQPLLVEVEGPGGARSGRGRLQQLVQAAVGVRVDEPEVWR